MSVLLVHGAWHGAWCWEPVLARLPSDARALDLPSNHGGGGLYDDAVAVRSVLDGMEAPVTLVGHSYGGAVLSEVGSHPNVERLVIVAGFPLDVGETIMANAAAEDPGVVAAPPTPLMSAIQVEGDTVLLDLDGARAAFYGDCAEQPVDRLVPHSLAAFTEPATQATWRSTPTTYVLCTHDEALHPAMQRFLAARCSETVVLEASHSPMLSMPGRLAEIIQSV